MQTVSQRKPQIMVRPDRELHTQVLAAGRQLGSMNKWAIQAFREKLAKKGHKEPLAVEPHHEDPRDELERAWTHALVRRLRRPGKARPLLEHLADVWGLPELPKARRSNY